MTCGALLAGAVLAQAPYNTAGQSLPNATAKGTNGQGAMGWPNYCGLIVGWSGSLSVNGGSTITVYPNFEFTGGTSNSAVRYIHYSVDGGPRTVVFDNPGMGFGGWPTEVGEWRVFALNLTAQPGTHTVTVYAANGYNTSQGGSPVAYSPEASASFTYTATASGAGTPTANISAVATSGGGASGGGSMVAYTTDTLSINSTATASGWLSEHQIYSFSGPVSAPQWIASPGGTLLPATSSTTSSVLNRTWTPPGYGTYTLYAEAFTGYSPGERAFGTSGWPGYFDGGADKRITVQVRRNPTGSIQVLDGSHNVLSPNGSGQVEIPHNSQFFIRINGSSPDGSVGRLYMRVNRPGGAAGFYPDVGASGTSTSYDFGPYTADTAGVWDIWGHVSDANAAAWGSVSPWPGNTCGWDTFGAPDILVTAPNVAPGAVNFTASATTVVIGQTVTFTSNLTDANGNLAFHHFWWDQGNGSYWTSPQIGWNFSANGAGWSNISNTNGAVANGSNNTITANWTPSALGTYVFHSNGYDSNGAWGGGNNITITVVNPSGAVTPAATLSATASNGSSANGGGTIVVYAQDSVTVTSTASAPGWLSEHNISSYQGTLNPSNWSYLPGGTTLAGTSAATSSTLSKSWTPPGFGTYTLYTEAFTGYSPGQRTCGTSGWPGYFDGAAANRITVQSRRNPTGLIQILNAARAPLAPNASGQVEVPLNSQYFVRVSGSSPDGSVGRLYFRMNRPNGAAAGNQDVPAAGTDAAYDFGPFLADENGVWDVWGHAADSLAPSWGAVSPWDGNRFGWVSMAGPDLKVVGGGTTPAVDTDGDGMPDDWENYVGLNPNVNDAGGNPDNDDATNLEEYNLWRDPRTAEQAGHFSPTSFSVNVTVLGKGTGTATVTVGGQTHNFRFAPPGGTQWSSPVVDFGYVSGFSFSAVPGETYPVSTSSSGLTDYIVKVDSPQETALTWKVKTECGGGYSNSIPKSDMQNGVFPLRVVVDDAETFGAVDTSRMEDRRVVTFGLGAGLSGETAGKIVWHSNPHLAGVVNYFGFQFVRGPALEQLWQSATRTQAKVPSGYVDVVRTRSTTTIRYYPSGSYPFSGGFNDFSAATPLASYALAGTLSSPSGSITRTIGGETTILEFEAEFRNWLGTVSESTDPVYGTVRTQPEYFESLLRIWSWRRPSAARPGLTLARANTDRLITTVNNNAPNYTGGAVTLEILRRAGSAADSPVASRELRTYSTGDIRFESGPATKYFGKDADLVAGPMAALVTDHAYVGLKRKPFRTGNGKGGGTFTEYFSEAADQWSSSNLGDQPVVAAGEPKFHRQSFLDDPVQSGTDLVTSYSYYADLVDGRVVPQRSVTMQGTTKIGEVSYQYTTGSLNGFTTVTTTSTNYAAPAESNVKSVRAYSGRISDADLRSRPLAVVNPDGTKTSYVYERGTLSGATWQANTADKPHLLVVELTGKTGGDLTSYSATVIDPITLDANRSLVVEKVFDRRGRVLRQITYVYTGGANFSACATEYYSYDSFENLVGRTEGPGGTGRIFYEASYSGFRKIWERDAQGIKTSYGYDDYGRVATVTREAAGSVAAGEGVAALTTTYVYDAIGRVVSEAVSSPGESHTLTTSYTYDTANRVRSKTLPGGFTTETSYPSVVTTTMTNPDGGTATTVVYADDRPKSVSGTAVVPSTTTFAYNSAGQLEKTESATGTNQYQRTTSDWLGRELSVTTPIWGGGTKTATKAYSPSTGQLMSITVTSGGSKIAPTQLFSYDPFGRLFREATDTNNNGLIDLATDGGIKEFETNFQSLALTRLDTGAAVNPAPVWYRYERVRTYPYEADLEGGVNRSGSSQTVSESFTQIGGLSDALSAHSLAIDADGNRTQSMVAIDRSNARVEATTLAAGSNQAAVSVTVNGQQLSNTNLQGQTTLTAYDGLGRTVGTSDPRIGATTLTYVANSTLVYRVTAPDGKQTTFGYDSAGRKSVETANDGKSSRMEYNALGKVRYVWGEVPNPVRYDYDPQGRRIAMYTYRSGTWTSATRPADFSSSGDKTAWAYDTHTGNLASKTDAANRTTSFTYNAAGQILTRTDARNWVTTYGYYGLADAPSGAFTGLQKSVDYSDADTSDISYTYHRSGKIRTVTDAAGTRTFNYYESWNADTDKQGRSGRLQSETLPAGYFGSASNVLAYEYQYGATGRRDGELAALQLGASSSYRVDYGYDDRLRLGWVAPNGVAAFTYTYATNSNLVQSVTQYTVGNAYDYSRNLDFEANADRVSGVRQYWGGSFNKSVEARVTSNSVGLRSSEKLAGVDWMAVLGRSGDHGVQSSFTYTDRREVDVSGKARVDSGWNVGAALAGTGRDYNYDPIGNRTADQSGSYSANNLNQYTAALGYSLSYDNNGNLLSDGVRAYAYDGENRLISVTQGGSTWYYRYDYLGRRIAKWGTGVSLLRFAYDGWNLIAELDGSGNLLRRFVWGLDASGSAQGAGGVGGLLLIRSGSSNYYPFYDASFNVIGLYDQAGTTVAAYEYDPFGHHLTAAGSQSGVNPFRSATKYTDLESSLVYYGYRYLNTTLGRFINRDPIEETGGINLYGFCRNDSVNNWDLLGCAIVDESTRLLEEMNRQKPTPVSGKPAPRGDDPNRNQNENQKKPKDEIVELPPVEFLYPPISPEELKRLEEAEERSRENQKRYEMYLFDPNNQSDQAAANSGAVNSGGIFAIGLELERTGVLRLEYDSLIKGVDSQTRDLLKLRYRGLQTQYGKAATKEFLKAHLPGSRSNPGNSNAGITKAGHTMKWVGRGAQVVAVGIEVGNVVNAPEGQRGVAAAYGTGRLLGAAAGGAVGATLGGESGNPYAVLGGIVIGGIAGAVGGEKTVDAMRQMASEPMDYEFFIQATRGM